MCGIHVKLITLPIIQINVENEILNWVSFCFVVRWCFNYRDSFVILGWTKFVISKVSERSRLLEQIKATIEIDKMAHASYLMPVTCYFNPNWTNFNDIWTRTLLAVRGSLNCMCYYAWIYLQLEKKLLALMFRFSITQFEEKQLNNSFNTRMVSSPSSQQAKVHRIFNSVYVLKTPRRLSH